MSGSFDPAPAAAMLAEAWHSGALLAELPPAIRPQTLAQGYDIQDRLVADLGHPAVGWKLGVGSALQKRQSGVGRSLAGRVLGSRLYRAGDTVPLPGGQTLTVQIAVTSTRSAPEDATTATWADSAANLFGAVTKGWPVSLAIIAAATSPKRGCVLMPVPTAVPPSASA